MIERFVDHIIFFSNCQRAIFNCCEEDIQKFPFRCFEINLCPTLFWGKIQQITERTITAFLLRKAGPHLLK